MNPNQEVCPSSESSQTKTRLTDDQFSELSAYATTLVSLPPIAMKARRIGNKPTNTELSSREYGILMSQSVTIEVHTQISVLLSAIMNLTNSVRLGISSNGGIVCFTHQSKDTFTTYLTPQQIIKLFGPLMKSIKSKLQGMKPAELTEIGIDIISCRDASFAALALHRAGVNCTSVKELNQCSAFFFSLNGSRGLKDPVYSSIYEESKFKTITVTFEESKDRVRINGALVSPIYSKVRIGTVATAKHNVCESQLSESEFTPSGVPSSRKKVTKAKNNVTLQPDPSSNSAPERKERKKKESRTKTLRGNDANSATSDPTNAKAPITSGNRGRAPLLKAQPEIPTIQVDPPLEELACLDATPDSETSDDSEVDCDFSLNMSS